jgi:hypothetical protein
MNMGRLMAWIGSILLFLTGIGHGFRIADVQKMIDASVMKAPLDAILKGCWLAFSGEMIALAVIVAVASWLQKGGSIVLIAAATMIANALLLLHFMGPFVGVYVSVIVAFFFLAAGLLQIRQTA